MAEPKKDILQTRLLKRLLSLSTRAISVLKYKIEPSTINYRRYSSLGTVKSVARHVLSSRLCIRRERHAKVEVLLCLDGLHYRRNRSNTYLPKLFESEGTPVLYNLDAVKSITAKELMRLICKLTCYFAFYASLSGANRAFIRTVFVDSVAASIRFGDIACLCPNRVVMIGKSYDLERFFLAYWLRNTRETTSVVYINRPIIGPYDSVLCDEIILSNKWVLEAYDILRARLLCRRRSCLHNMHFLSIGKVTKENCDYRRNRIAFYMSGAYVRQKLAFSTRSFLEDELRREALLMELIKEYAVSFPDLVFVIFPHPTVETGESSKERYKELLQIKNVSLRPEGKSSADLYDEFEVGISSGSNTIFERIESGHKGAFVWPSESLSIYMNTSLAPVLFSETDVKLEALEDLRKLEHADFYRLIHFS